MRILLISPSVSRAEVCGVKDYTILLARYLEEYGQEVIILCETNENLPQRLQESKGIKILPLIRRYDLSEARRIIDLAKDLGIDTIHLQFEDGIYKENLDFRILPKISHKEGVPFITTFHSFGKSLKSRLINSFFFHFSKKVIVLDIKDKKFIQRFLPFYRKKLRVIPLSSNIPQVAIDREEARREIFFRYNIEEDFIVLSYFGFICEGKGLPTIFKALRLLKDRGYKVRLFLIGAERKDFRNFKEKLEKLAKKLNIEDFLIYTGYLQPQEISKIISSSLCYLAVYDTGLRIRRATLFTGLIQGVPVISTYPKIMPGGFKDRENIYLVGKGHPGDLTEGIQEIHRDTKLRERIARGGKKLSQQFNWNITTSEHIKLYRSLF